VARQLDPATKTATEAENLNFAWIIRLDIQTDPVLAWTGFGDLTFAAGQTGDGALDGQTFQGITHLVAEIGAVGDGDSGSQALELRLPGVDLQDELLKQVVYDRRKWKFRQAWAWIALFDDAGNVIGKPIRVKTGRMDQMAVSESEDGEGLVICTIESQQAYASEALNTRWSEQTELDPNDNSQQYVWALANMTPALGQSNIIPGAGGYGGGGYGGDYGGGGRFINENVNLV
jgi:hypothetical protein